MGHMCSVGGIMGPDSHVQQLSLLYREEMVRSRCDSGHVKGCPGRVAMPIKWDLISILQRVQWPPSALCLVKSNSCVPVGILSLGSISFLSGICTLPLRHVSPAFGWKLNNLHNGTAQLWALGSMLSPGWVTQLFVFASYKARIFCPV